MRLTIEVDEELRELCQHGTPLFPLEINHDELRYFQDFYIPCHWHDELELSLLLEGSVIYQIDGITYKNISGQGMIINTDIPHMVLPTGMVSPKLLTIIVHPSLLYGMLGSAVDISVMRPYQRSRSLSGIRLDPSVPWQSRILESMRCIDKLYTTKPFAYELKIKSLLCDMFYEIIVHHKGTLKHGTYHSMEELQRLKILLDYLHTNYSNPLSLTELAGCIPITRENCCRFFKKMTGRTVSQYLEDYRIAQSLHLLQVGKLPIAQIAYMTGFSNASRFAAAFRARMGCTPAKYRKTFAPVSDYSAPTFLLGSNLS